MLVLSRNREQEIRIGKDITVKVTRIAKGRVWLGVDAPRELPIIRPEAHGQQEKAAA